MSEQEKTVITECPTCGKQMLVNAGAVNVYCMKCEKWSKIVPVKNKDADGNDSIVN